MPFPNERFVTDMDNEPGLEIDTGNSLRMSQTILKYGPSQLSLRLAINCGLLSVPTQLDSLANQGSELLCPANMPRISVGMATCGQAAGAGERLAILAARHDIINQVLVRNVGCLGACFGEPLIDVRTPDGLHYIFGKTGKESSWPIIHTAQKRSFQRGTWLVLRERNPGTLTGFDDLIIEKVFNHDLARFFQHQKRRVSGNCGLIDPQSLPEYVATGGYFAFAKALLELTPSGVITEIAASGLRGRGGGGFKTGDKWEIAATANDRNKIIIANADEGDPGAYMDRTLMESDPHRVLEGIMLAAYAVGATRAHIFIRHEYPMSIQRMKEAIRDAQAAGLLGENILGSGFSLKVSITENAGAFVCGEETSMLNVMEGQRGEPRPRPPYPAEEGLNGHPTVINNIETFANVPWIIANGADAFRETGTLESPGTKIFCLTGDIANSGFIEVPFGTSVQTVVEKIGGTPPDSVKAIQIGGPSGGIVPYSDFSLDYSSMASIGAMIGSGGLVVLDKTRCLVDLSHHLVSFMADESCGRCLFCRDGLTKLKNLLQILIENNGTPGIIESIEELCHAVADLSLCGLGRSAVNPLLTTLRFFRPEYEEHVRGICSATYCKSMIHLKFIAARCTDNQICYDICPVQAIKLGPGRGPERYYFDHDACLRCRSCVDSCPHGAIIAVSGEELK